MQTHHFALPFALLCLAGFAPSEAATLAETPRALPVAAGVDVVVVGGSSAGVAAAVAAARAGAKVFLAAPRSYLGEDLCGTLRLGLEPGETPQDALARQLFLSETASQTARPSIPFTYTSDLPTGTRHHDSPTQPRLTDGVWDGPNASSVQYDGDAILTLDCARSLDVTRVTVMAYRRRNDFAVAAVAVESSDDGLTWQPIGTVTSTAATAALPTDATEPLTLTAQCTARFLRLHLTRAAGCPRMLLGEVLVEAAGATPLPPPTGTLPQPPTPLHVKRVLDQALLDAGVTFVFGSYASDVLLDGAGNPAGVVMANRAGRQAVIARVIIDATERATVARLAGASFSPYPATEQTFRRVVIGGTPPPNAVRPALNLPFTVAESGTQHAAHEFLLSLPMANAEWSSFALAEQVARDATWCKGAVVASETLFQIPPDFLVARCPPPSAWLGPEHLPLDVCRPAMIDAFYVVGGCAGVSREHAATLLRPLAFLTLGQRVGEAAAAEALARPALVGVHLPGTADVATEKGNTTEQRTGLRAVATAGPTVPAERRLLPVVGRYDVVVVGGGTGGAPAAIGAARRGAKTLVIESLYELGGVSTVGLIGKYYHGNRVGFTREIDAGVVALGADVGVLGKSEYYRRTIRAEGGEIWFGALAVGTWVEDGTVRGVVVATPQGRFAVAAGVVVDATGNADIAAAAGAPTTFVSGEHVAMQGTGLPPVRLGASYINTDYTFVDDADMLDLWRLFVTGRQQAGRAFDLGQLPDTRERRRIVGEAVITPLDILNQRTWPDTVCIAKSDFDSHGYTVHPVFLLQPPARGARDLTGNIPYRALIPQGLDGLLVIGLGISAHRDAMPILRMQPDVQNLGYAAGVAAAMAARYTEGAVRRVDIAALQQHLVEVKNLPAAVLSQKDSYPLSAERLAAAVAQVPTGGNATMAVILADPTASLPSLQAAYRGAKTTAERLAYAHILGMLGDDTGTQTLIDTVAAASWDPGWNFRGMGQYGASLSPLDSQLIALGRTRRTEALPVLIQKARTLASTNEFSHYRALAMAFESLHDRAAAVPLANLLNLPGMTGHTLTAPDAPENRNASLRELILARALYRCGDHDGLGERILRQYEADLRGVFSRHAHAVLTDGP